MSQAWDFTLDEDPAAATTPPSGDFVSFLHTASRVFPRLDLEGRERVLVLVGDWHPEFVDRLAARPQARLERSVPGLYAFVVDVAAVMAPAGEVRISGSSGPPTGDDASPPCGAAHSSRRYRPPRRRWTPSPSERVSCPLQHGLSRPRGISSLSLTPPEAR